MWTKPPPRPEISPEIWQRLFVAAQQFRELSPWEWMGDNHALVIGESDGRPVRLASIFGAIRQLFGLTLFCGAEGIATYFEYASVPDGAVPDRDILYRQRSLHVEFESKSALADEDRALFKRLGYTAPKMPHAWPTFRSYRPGFYPWFIERHEAEMLIDDLDVVSQFARLLQRRPQLGDNYERGLFPFYDAGTGPIADDGRNLQWRELFIRREPPPPVPVTERQVSALLEIPRSEGLRLALDTFHGPTIVADFDRPYFGKVSLVVTADSGFCAHQCLDGPDKSVGEAAVDCLVAACGRIKARPSTVLVSRPEILVSLSQLAKAAHIQLELEPALPILEELRISLERDFRRS